MAANRTVFIVCEGQTEETFISTVVAPHFYPLGINLVAQLIETSPGHKGGALSYERVRKHLRNVLRRGSEPVVTTLFDLYKLDTGFPGFDESREKPLEERLEVLTRAFHEDIVGFVGCRPSRFLPYFQPYEFEALLFSDVARLIELEVGWAGAIEDLKKVRDAAVSPEHINDGPNTKPAAHLQRCLVNPKFRKALHGPLAAEQITLEKIERECPFFAGWILQLRGVL
jgi:hypothetical protein